MHFMLVLVLSTSPAADSCFLTCNLCQQVLGGEEILKLPPKTEELLPGNSPPAICTILVLPVDNDAILLMHFCSSGNSNFAGIPDSYSRALNSQASALQCKAHCL